MGLIDNLNQRAKRFSIFDVKLIQCIAMFFALIIAKLVPEVMTVSIWWFVGLLILFSAKPFYVFWLK